ncbi:MAG: putative DNA binding domain-containing protein [Clostridia bacterium]|nr:putative DNA binding domain-containing protein [Clostridia bacterium]
MHIESERVEFKSQFTDDLYKEIIAFANTDGGVVYVGIDGDGNAIGLDHVDADYTRITNGIRDAIAPDVTMFTQYTIQEDNVVRVDVGEGSNKPYYLKSKGLKPTGVFVRQGASSVPASPEAIRQMIKDSDGDVFEEMRSMNQRLTFEAAADAFKKYGVAFGKEKYRALGLTRSDGDLFTNLALLLSDQCAHSVKIAVFGDEAKTTFKDQRELTGSIFTQLEDAFHYLTLCNQTAAVFRGLERVERPDYPEEALREALLNAVVHRDYGYSGSIIINVNDREMEFISLGGLLPGLTPDDIRAGISQPRNKNLAAVFHRLRLIESYGTGIRRIYALYADCPAQPRIEVTANTFKMVLPNMNAARAAQPPRGGSSPAITAQMRKILDYIGAHGQITDEEIQALLDIRKTRAFTLARQMRDMDLIAATGRGKDKVYRATRETTKD